MIKNLNEVKKFGTIDQTVYVLKLLEKGNSTFSNLQSACKNRSYSFTKTFAGTICLLKELSYITILDENISINSKKKLTIDHSFFKSFFLKLVEKKIFFQFLNHTNIYVDKENNLLIRNSLIDLEFSAIRNLLLNFEFFIKDNIDKNQFIVNHVYQNWFKEFLSKNTSKHSRKFTLEDLKKLNERKEELGYESELFVLKYEQERLTDHMMYSSIKIISNDDVSAGYDIESFTNKSSIMTDRFIEVKSYQDEENFYWSRNEIEVAKEKAELYYLYLVDRNRINELNYNPMIIQNPYLNILNNDNWNKEIEKYFITKN